MYKYFTVENGKYSHAFQKLHTCMNEAKTISAIYRAEVYVVNDDTAEVIAIYDMGLLIEG